MIIWGGYNGSQQVNTGGRYCAAVPTPTPTATVTPTPTATATATATATGNGYTERNTNCNCDGIFYTYGDTYVDAETYSHTEASSEAGVAPVTLALVRSSASPRGALETRSFAGLKKPPRVIKPKRTARGWSRV